MSILTGATVKKPGIETKNFWNIGISSTKLEDNIVLDAGKKHKIGIQNTYGDRITIGLGNSGMHGTYSIVDHRDDEVMTFIPSMHQLVLKGRYERPLDGNGLPRPVSNDLIRLLSEVISFIDSNEKLSRNERYREYIKPMAEILIKSI